MNTTFRNKALILTAALSAPMLASAATTFNDDFSTSTMNSASPALPTASSTDYAVLASKDGTGSSIGVGSLDLTIPATSSGFAEMQARFSAAPVSLSSAGDYIMLTMGFQSTHVLDISDGTGTQTINVGLYNSGGVSPVPGGAMANSGMGSGTAFVTGYAQNWAGYAARVGNVGGGNGSQIFTRDPQTDTTDENQDLLFNNAGTGAFDTPSGTTLGSGSLINLLDATDYTLTFLLSYDGTDVTVTENIYEGIGTGGVNVYSLSGTDSGGYTDFDALSFGFRGRNTSGEAIHLTLSSLDISSSVVPEPGSLALLGFAAGLMAFFRRNRR